MRTLVIACATGSLLTACNDTGPPDGASGRVRHEVTERGVVEQPVDTTALAELAGSDGTTWVEVRSGRDRLLVARGTDALDLASYRFGRSDVARPSAPTPVTLGIDGLADWSTSDTLQLVVPNSGAVVTGVADAMTGSPGVGATTLRGAVDWQQLRAPLVDPSAGDVAWLLQLRSAPFGNTSYDAVVRAGVARNLGVDDGHATPLSASLSAPRTRTLELRWRGAAFAALAADAGPNTRPAPAPAIAIRTMPTVLAERGAGARTAFAGLPALVELGPVSGTADVTGAVTYAAPFGRSDQPWTEVATVVYAMPVQIATRGGVGSTSALAIATTAIDATGAAVELTPAVSPVRNARLDGKPLDAPITDASAAPVVTWDAPARGHATGYAVAISAIESTAGGVRVKRLAAFHTTATSAALPAAVLSGVTAYVVTVTAIAAPGLDVARRPFLGALPYASADYVGALVTR